MRFSTKYALVAVFLALSIAAFAVPTVTKTTYQGYTFLTASQLVEGANYQIDYSLDNEIWVTYVTFLSDGVDHIFYTDGASMEGLTFRITAVNLQPAIVTGLRVIP